MSTLEDEFQKPVRELFDAIVIPSGELPAWDIYPPETNYDEWFLQQSYEADQIVTAARQCFDDIERGDHGVLSGQFPSPTPRKRKRNRKPREWAGDKDL